MFEVVYKQRTGTRRTRVALKLPAVSTLGNTWGELKQALAEITLDLIRLADGKKIEGPLVNSEGRLLGAYRITHKKVPNKNDITDGLMVMVHNETGMIRTQIIR